MATRDLAPLDAAFLEIEGPSAHMHVGFAARLTRSEDGSDSSFPVLRDHIASRLGRAPRYRQRLAFPPLGMGDPVWVDDSSFDVRRHVLHSRGKDFGDVVAQVMSVPLERDRPLWEMWVADELADGSIALVGKLHHCMVDGIAAVELATMLFDAEPHPEPAPGDGAPWSADPTPDVVQATAALIARTARETFSTWSLPARLALDPARLLALPGATLEAARTAAAAILPASPTTLLNRESSPLRHLATVRRPLDELRRIKRAHATTVNDVMLAACADALGRFVANRGEEPGPLRAMVPVNVRDDSASGGALGNRISFLFLDLPCAAADAAARLAAVHRTTTARKERGEAGHTTALIDLLGRIPRAARRLAGHVLASPRTANLVVSNIPGPPVPLWMAGCALEEAFPIVPLTGDHGVSIGMLTVAGQACFGLYADRKTLPDVGLLAEHLEDALDDLLATA